MENKKLDKFFFYATIPLRPNFWTLNSRYNKNVDEFIVDILDRNVKGEYNGQHYVSYGEVMVWVGSYPYSYTTIFNSPIKGRASRYTIYRYRKYFDRLAHERDVREMKGMSEKEYLSLDRIAMQLFSGMNT